MGKRFQSPNILRWVIIPGSITFLFVLSHYPNVIPISHLGVVGHLLSYLVSHCQMILAVVFWSTIVAHVYEAIIARGICQKLNIDQGSTLLWMIQTFILGFPSLSILKGYARQRND